MGAGQHLRDISFMMIARSFLFFAIVCAIVCNSSAISAYIRPETKLYHDVIDLVPDSVLDNKMKQSFRDVVQFADKLFRRIDKPPQHPPPISLALLRLYALQTHLASIPTQNGSRSDRQENNVPAQLSEEFVAEALHFYRFAVAVYNAKPGIIQQDILLNNLEDKDACNIKMPRHIVFLDHVTKSIVISIRGTASVSDMLTDLYIEPYPFLEPSRNLFAHHGMAESAETLLPLVTAAIQEIRQRAFSASANPKSSALAKILARKTGKRYKYKDYRVVVTGHSLGAGTASLLAMLLSTQSNITATAFAYAPPPVVSSTQYQSALSPQKWRTSYKFPFVKRKAQSSYQIHSFVHNLDIISRSSHTQILSLVSAIVAVDKLPWGMLDRMGILFRNTLSEEEKRTIHDALLNRTHFIEGNDHELYVPGEIYLLKPFVPKTGDESSVGRGLVANETQHNASTTNTASRSHGNVTVISKSTCDVTEHTGSKKSSATTTTTSAATPKSKEQVVFDLFGASIAAPTLPEFPELPPFPEFSPLPPQLLEALQNLLAPLSNHTSIAHTSASASVATAGSDHHRMDTYHAQNSAPSSNATKLAPGPAKNTTLSAYYHCVKVLDPGSLFNGLMYYGDGMVADHLTTPFENALLLLTSLQSD